MRRRHRLRPAEPDDFVFETSDSALSDWLQIKTVSVLGRPAAAVRRTDRGRDPDHEHHARVRHRADAGDRDPQIARAPVGGDILDQFLVEATTLSLLGAIAGIGLGVALSTARRALSPLPATIAPMVAGGGRHRRCGCRHRVRRVSRIAGRATGPDRRACAPNDRTGDARTRVGHGSDGRCSGWERVRRSHSTRFGRTVFGPGSRSWGSRLASSSSPPCPPRSTGSIPESEQSLAAAGPTTFFVTRWPMQSTRCSGDAGSCPWRHNKPLSVREAAIVGRSPTVHAVIAHMNTTAVAKVNDRVLSAANVDAYTAAWLEVDPGSVGHRSHVHGARKRRCLTRRARQRRRGQGPVSGRQPRRRNDHARRPPVPGDRRVPDARQLLRPGEQTKGDRPVRDGSSPAGGRHPLAGSDGEAARRRVAR